VRERHHDDRTGTKEHAMSTTVITPDLTALPATMTIPEVAELLGISRSAAYRAVARGEIPTIRIGRRLLVPTAKLYAMLGWLPEPAG
jgi:excisionase family DNA binding protein